MEYTVKDVNTLNLKIGDVVYYQNDWQEVSELAESRQTIFSTYVTFKRGGTYDIHNNTTFLCRVPSSPVMSKEEFKKKHCMNTDNPSEVQPMFDEICQIKYEGYLIGTRSIVPEMTDGWFSVEEDGYPTHNGEFLCRVLIEQQCGAIWDKQMVIPYVFTQHVKMPLEAKMKNGIVNEYGCNYFHHDSDEPLKVIEWRELPPTRFIKWTDSMPKLQ